MMEPFEQHSQKPFIEAFVSFSLDPNLGLFSTDDRIDSYVTDIWISKAPFKQSPQFELEHYALDQDLAIFVSRTQQKLPISKIENFESLPDGWEELRVEGGASAKISSKLGLLRSSSSDSEKCICQIQIHEEQKNHKSLQTTQPTLQDKPTYQNIFEIAVKNEIKYVSCHRKKTCKKIDHWKSSFKPIDENLLKQEQKSHNLSNIAFLCFPEGLKIFKKQTGFKFFNFILTGESGERHYCNSVLFTQKCSLELRQKFKQLYEIESEKGIFCQKTLTLISSYNCTDQVNKCLEYLYRIYLTQSAENFRNFTAHLSSKFTINPLTLKCRFNASDFGLGFKVNSSYHNTSVNAIYAIFKFLEVPVIVRVLESLLLEKKIFFISDCINIIGFAIEAFLSFIYPLNWIHNVVSPLPASLLDYTEAPMPIIYGVLTSLSKKISSKVEGVFVYLDKNTVEHRGQQQISLKLNLRSQLVDRLKVFSAYDPIDIRDYLRNPENLSLFKTRATQDPHFDAYKIRNILLELMVYLLRNYKQYYLPIQIETSSETRLSIQKYYDMKALAHYHRKDPFMLAFLETSLFTALVEAKKFETNNKWIRMLDRAIKKISKFEKNYIQEQSDNQSDTNEPEEEHVDLPKSCLNLISLFSKQSEEDKSNYSSPSPKKAKSLSKKTAETPETKKIECSEDEQIKSDKETSAENRESLKEFPELDDRNGQKIIYDYEVDQAEENQIQPGVAYHFCMIFSYPIDRVSKSIAGRWTKSKLAKLREWALSRKKEEGLEGKQQKKNE